MTDEAQTDIVAGDGVVLLSNDSHNKKERKGKEEKSKQKKHEECYRKDCGGTKSFTSSALNLNQSLFLTAHEMDIF